MVVSDKATEGMPRGICIFRSREDKINGYLTSEFEVDLTVPERCSKAKK